MTKPKVYIEVVSDVIWPWCYIGKRRMENAVQALKARFDFDIVYSPFELNPDMPSAGVDQKAFLAKKFGSDDRYAALTQNVTKIAASEGLHYDFERQHVIPNTRVLHRMISYARKERKQAEINEAFMKAYFEDGIDLSKTDNILGVCEKVGLEKSKAEIFLRSDEGLADVEAAELLNHERGISGVPFFVINGKYGISGAQQAEVLTSAFEEIMKKETPVIG